MYTLYGNTRSNNFECKEDKDCFMLGGNGGDSFSVNRHHTGSVIGDFRQRLDEDVLIVGRDKGKPTFEYTQNGHDYTEDGVEIKISYGGIGGSGLLDSREVVFIEGVTLEEVEGWVSVADGSYRETEEGKELSVLNWEKKRADNPIQIK